MTVAFHKGRYGVRLADTDADIAACQALRHRCFFGRDGIDADAFDPACTHVMIAGEFGLVCTFRIAIFESGGDLSRSYAAESYDLKRLAEFDAPLLEMGRFCIDPAVSNADVLRLAWGALTRIVDAHGIKLLFGCASFAGVDPTPYRGAFGLLAARYRAPDTWAPAVAAAETITLDGAILKGAVQQMPPLLRSYLAMGGWVSDHAVVDRHMQTIHVFTGLEIDKVPQARAKALRALVG